MVLLLLRSKLMGKLQNWLRLLLCDGPLPAFGHPPLQGEGLGDQDSRWRSLLCLWLPASGRGRG